MNPNLENKISNLYPSAQGVRLEKNVMEGYLSQNFILSNTKLKFFLKEYSANYTLDVLKEIHRVKFFFEKEGIPVILPYKNKKNETIFEDKGRYFSLFPFVVGIIHPREKLSINEIKNLGRLLAEVHILSKNGIPFKIEEEKGKWDLNKFQEKSQLILEIVEGRKKKTKFDELTLEVLKRKIKIVNKNKLLAEDLGLKNDHLLHGDFHEKNVFFNKDESVKYLFDWEKTCIGPRAFELSRALDLICLNGDYNKEHIESAKMFLEEYSKFYPITKEEFYKGMTYYFLKKAHSLWIETEHYIKKTMRVDVFFERELLMLNYYDENLDSLVHRIYER